MKLKLKIADSTSRLPWLCLHDYWINHDERFFPYSLSEQKQNVRRLIKKYCNDNNKVLEIASVFPSVMECVSECIKERLISPDDVELTIYREEDCKGHSFESYHFKEDGDLDGDYKLCDLVNWLLH